MNEPPSLSRRSALVAAALVLYAFAFQGSRGLWERDEGRYTNVALTMLRTGDYLVPRMNSEQVHLSKPPLTYWAIAASVRLFGRNEWAVRAPYALAFVLTVLLVYGIARRLNAGRAWLAPVIYATSLLPFAAANIVTTDALLTLWETLAVWGFVRLHWADPAAPRQGVWGRLAMWAGFGLAFLTKGPPGLLPLAAIALFALSTRGARGLVRLLSPTGIVLFLATGFGWFLAVALQDRERFVFFLRDEFLNRVASGKHGRNAGLFDGLMYVPILFVGLLPWMAFALRGFRERARRLWQLRTRAAREERPADSFLALWVLLPLVVFTLARSRLPLYVLPLCVPLSVALSRAVPAATVESPKWRRLFVCWTILLVVLRGAAALVPGEKNDRATAAAIRERITGPIREVVFVNNRAWYGLSFYLDCEVKSVALSRDDSHFGPAYYYAASTLAEDLARGTEGKTYMVKPSRETEFRDAAHGAGFAAVRAGETVGFGLYRLREEGAP